MSEKILEKIYQNTYDEVKLNEAFYKLNQKAENLYDTLIKTLSGEQKKDLDKLIDLHTDMQAEISQIHFDYGFKLAIMLAFECFN